MKYIEDIDFYKKNYCTCKKCKSSFKFKPDETFWDEHGTGYSVKLVKCPVCGCVNVVEHIEDYGFSKQNDDVRWYYK